MSLPMIPADKANHMIYGSGIALVAQTAATPILLHFGIDPNVVRPKDIGLAASAMFAGGKEAADWVLNRLAVRRGEKPRHGVEPLDALATVAGGLAIWSAQP